MVMRLKSTAFTAGGEIPARFTCEGSNLSPPLAWSDPPAAARSFALICRDPDAPARTFYHWAVYNIPANITHLPEGWASHATGARQALNDFSKIGYGGPCPPHGHGSHHYHFVLYALDITDIDVPARASCRTVENAVEDHAVATAELTGTFAR